MPNPIFPGAQYSNPATVTVSSDAVSGSINEGATRKSDGTPMSGKTALPTWQVLKW